MLGDPQEPRKTLNDGVKTLKTSENEPVKRKIDKPLLIVSFGVAIGLVLIGWGFNSATTGRAAQNIPKVIERITPGPNDQVVLQAQVIVDFISGYQASLSIDGIDIPTTRLDQLSDSSTPPRPGSQLDIPPTAIFDPGNSVISFQPQKGAVVESLTQGMHSATVTYWKIVDGPTKSQTFSWTFQAN